MNRQQICEMLTTSNSKKGFTLCNRLLERSNCQHLTCFRAMKEVLKDKWYTSERTGDIHITEESSIDPGWGTLETGDS